MYSLPTLALVTQLLVSSTNAQNSTGNSTSSKCADIIDVVSFNASSFRPIQALRIDENRPRDLDTDLRIKSRLKLVNDTSRMWELSVRVRPQEPETQQTAKDDAITSQQFMYLDTKGSNMTDIGSCHQTIQPEYQRLGFEWTKEVMELALKDNGDCTTLLGNECIQALKFKAKDQASEWPMRTGSCSRMNATLPAECSGVGFQLRNREMNMTYLDGPGGTPNSNFPSDLQCNGVNVSSTHSVSIAERMAYDAAIRFPTIDVISFWPNRMSGMQSYETGSRDEVHVEVVCMKPDSNIAKGSDTPPSGEDILNRESSRFPLANGASVLRSGVLGWVSVGIVGVMVML